MHLANDGRYATGAFWGWYYSDSEGNATETCAGGNGLTGPENVSLCNVDNAYYKQGTDQCIILPGCCWLSCLFLTFILFVN